MGPNGSGKSTLAYVLAGKADYEVTDGEVLLDGENLLEHGAGRARRQGRVPRVPVSAGDPRRRHHDLPAHRAQRAAQGARRGRAVDAGVHEARARGGRQARRSTRRCCGAPVNVGFSGGEKKRNEILQMALLEPRLVRARRDRFRPRHRRAARSSPTASTRCARPSARMLVITHYQRLLDYIVPDIVHVLSQGPHREDRRQGAGARARGQGLRAITRTRRRERMNADVASDQDRGRDRRSRERIRGARRRRCRAARSRRCARRRSTRFEAARPAAPARRGVEIHRPARADARRAAAGRARRTPPPRRAPRTPARCSPASTRVASCFVDGVFAPELSDLRPIAGLTIDVAGARRWPTATRSRPARHGRRDRRRRASRSTPRCMRDGAVIDVADGRRVERPIHLRVRRGRRQAAVGLHALAGRASSRAPRSTLVESHDGADGATTRSTPRSSSSVGDDAQVDHIKIDREGDDGAARLDA